MTALPCQNGSVAKIYFCNAPIEAHISPMKKKICFAKNVAVFSAMQKTKRSKIQTLV